jgi:hypothetical protein
MNGLGTPIGRFIPHNMRDGAEVAFPGAVATSNMIRQKKNLEKLSQSVDFS